MRIDIEKIWKILAKKVRIPGTLADTTVGHVPLELSRYFHFAMKHGCEFEGTVAVDKFKRSPLTQGGLEIVCTVEATWESRVGMEKLKDLLKDYSVNDNEKDDSDIILQEIREQLGAEESQAQEVTLEDENEVDIEMIDDE